MRILIYLLYFLIGFVRVFGTCYLLRNVFRCKIRNYLLLSACSGTLTFLWILIPSLFDRSVTLDNYTQAFVMMPLIWFFVTERSPKSVVAVFSGYTFTNCVGIMLEVPVNTIVGFVSERKLSDGIMLYFVMLAAQMLTLGTAVLIGRIGRSRMTEPLSVWNMLFMAVLAFFTNQMLMLLLSKNSDSQSFEQLLTVTGISLFAVAFILISVVMTVKLTESRYYSALNSMNESYLNAQKNYYEMKQSADNEIRRIRHDMKNHLICIKDLAAQCRYEELNEYLKEFSEAVSDADRLIHTGSGIIDAIVNEKAALARKMHIKFDWEGTISGLRISAIDSCTLVSNLLDNAIEACEKVDTAKRYISLSFRRSEHFLLMTCENSAVRVVGLSNGRPLTSKADRYNHGFGIGNIERCVEKYGGHLDLASYIEDDTPVFKAEAVIPLGPE